ncbi:MAG: OmpH family outer membrane protein [Bacillota bacterium]
MILSKKNVLVLLLGILTVFTLFNSAHTFASEDVEGKIVFVDVQEVFEVHPDKKNAEKELNEAAQKMQSELENEASDLSEEKQKDLLNNYQSELSEKEQELIQNVLEEIEKAIQEVAEEKKVKLVLDKRNVIYGGYDMTQDVIDYINSQSENDEENSTSQEDE